MKVRRLDGVTERRYLRFLSGGTLYHEPQALAPVTSEALFGDERPLEVEVGCGTGDFLNALAERDSGANFVGVDLHMKSLYRAVETAAGGDLGNVLYLSADFTLLYPLLQSGSLRAVYLRFPDPGMKPRQERRRIFDRRFLDEVYRALAPDGQLLVVTDHPGYHEQMTRHAAADGRWRIHTGEPESEPGVRSRFQRLWEDEYGRRSQSLTLYKR